jgi:predicted TIM-barrel fold metal-dependent hydrolase
MGKSVRKFMIVDTHVHAFTDDRVNYPKVRDTPRAGKVPSVTNIGQTEWPVTTGETLVSLMDEAGVDRATITQAYFTYEYDNRYMVDAARAHADLLTAICVLDPLDPRSPDELSRLVEQGVTGLRFMRGRLPASSLGDPATFPLWERVQSLRIPVIIANRIEDYAKARRAMERYPDVKVSFEHSRGHTVGLPPYPVLEPLFAFADNPNVNVKTAINNIAAARAAGGELRDLYSKLVQVFGARRIMWSSNYPAHPHFGSLSQRLEISRRELSFLSAEDQA